MEEIESQIEQQKLISIKTNWNEEENNFVFVNYCCRHPRRSRLLLALAVIYFFFSFHFAQHTHNFVFRSVNLCGFFFILICVYAAALLPYVFRLTQTRRSKKKERK